MVLYTLDLLGTAVFAITGVLVACRKGMDLFGVLVLAFVTAVGGGTIRDMLLGHGSVFWMNDINYLYVIIASTLAGYTARSWCKKSQNLILFFDAVGLATFVIIGVEKTLGLGYSPLVAIMMGVLTGAGGGAIRDLLAGTIPGVLKQEIYATAALAGGLLYIVMNAMMINQNITAISAASFVLALRMISIRRNLSLPSASLNR